MNKEQFQVYEFMKLFGQPCRIVPEVPPDEEADLRMRLIEEEFNELQKAFINKDLVEIADALADLQYVLLGTAISAGINLDPVFQEVHRSNMSKFWTSSEVANHFKKDAQELFQLTDMQKVISNQEGQTAMKLTKTKWVVKEKGGKIVKSPSYSAVNIRQVLDLQQPG